MPQKARRSRRDILREGGLVGGTLLGLSLSGCSGDGSEDTPTPEDEDTPEDDDTPTDTGTPEPERFSVKAYESEGSSSIMYYVTALENNIWDQHNIDFSFEVSGFQKYSRVFLSDLTNINTQAPINVQAQAREGAEIYMVDGHENMLLLMFANRDSDIQAPPDLANARLGVPFETSAATMAHRVIALERHDFDILEDTEETIAAPPENLWTLFEQGELDAMIQFSGLTIRGLAREQNDELVRTIQNPIPAWEEVTGQPPAVTVIAADKTWVDENPEKCLRYLRAEEAAQAYFADNISTAMSNYGRLAGFSTEAETNAYQEIVQEGTLDASGPETWTQEYIDAQWLLFERLEELGMIDFVPDKEESTLLRSDIESMAEGN